MTDAHTEMQHVTLQYAFPAHEPRESDPHYKVFNQTRARLKRLGALKCWIDNADCCPGPIELHHSMVEFALTNDVDWEKFAHLYPEFHIESDEDFLTFVEGEGNLTCLCVAHHRGHLGIHFVPYPMWQVQRFLKNGIAAPARTA